MNIKEKYNEWKSKDLLIETGNYELYKTRGIFKIEGKKDSPFNINLNDLRHLIRTKCLIICDTGLHYIPMRTIKELRNLHTLILTDNKIEYIPEQLFDMNNIDHINLMNNNISDISDSTIQKIKGSKRPLKLNLSMNPLNKKNIRKIKKQISKKNNEFQLYF